MPRRLREDERRLWSKVARSIEPLPGRRVPEEPEPAAAPERSKPADPARPATSSPKTAAARSRPPPPVSPRSGHHQGLDRRTAERLRRGKLSVDGAIDLHGMTQAGAHRALQDFISISYRQRRRVLLVVTGKGTFGAGERGILRARLPHWLSEPGLRDMVLAYHPARPQDGGDGAFYVLLRRLRDR